MNSVEEKILEVLAIAAKVAVPIFVHSDRGVILANAGEELLIGALQIFGQQAASAAVQPKSAA